MLGDNFTAEHGKVETSALLGRQPMRVWDNLHVSGAGLKLVVDGSLFESQLSYAFTVAAKNIEYEGKGWFTNIFLIDHC